ncbi:MAG: hypothetical protein ACR2FO_09285 [Actinomycetota bacterium]
MTILRKLLARIVCGRLWAVKVFLVFAAGIVASAASSSTLFPPNVSPGVIRHPRPVLSGSPAAENPGERARTLYAALVAKRIARGKLPLDEQVARYAVVANKSPDEVSKSGTAVITLAVPMPLDVYHERPLSIPLEATSVTLYLELADGYPFKVFGKVDEDLEGKLSSFMEFMAKNERSGPSTPSAGAPPIGGEQNGTPASSKDPDAAKRLADQIDAGRASLPRLGVILGFTMTPNDYKRISDGLNKDFDIGAVEIMSAGGSPFKMTEDRIDANRVEEFRLRYRTRS